MTHAKIRTNPRRFRGWLVATLGLFVAASAVAEVQLTNTVKKVESFLNEEGVIERRLVDAERVVPGDELRYAIRVDNEGEAVVDAGSIVITNPIPNDTEYLEGTAFGAGTEILFSVDGEHFDVPEALVVLVDGVEVPASAKDYQAIRWTFQPELAPSEGGFVTFNIRLK